MKGFALQVQRALLDPAIIRSISWFVGAGVVLYLLAIIWLGWRDILTSFSTIGFQTLIVAAVISCMTYLLRFARWDYSMRRLGNIVPRGAHLGIYLAGLALTASPAKSGETLRSALLLRYGVKIQDSLGAFLADRGSDVAGMILLGALAAVALGQHSYWIWLVAFGSLLLGSRALAYLLLLPQTRASSGGIALLFNRLPIHWSRAPLEAWAKVWTLPRASVFSIIAVLAYGTQAILFFWFCQALGTSLSLPDSILIFVRATLFGAATLVPGGLGTMEVALVVQLTDQGVHAGIATSIAIAFRAITLWLGMAIGVMALKTTTNNARS